VLAYAVRYHAEQRYALEVGGNIAVAATSIVADSEPILAATYAMAQAYPPRYARWEEVDGDDN
jgi:hypothetical protein